MPGPDSRPTCSSGTTAAYEGRTSAEIRAERPGWDLFRDGCPGGESVEEVGARADRVVAHLKHAGGRVILFGHGHFFRVLAARWLGLPPADGASLLAGHRGALRARLRAHPGGTGDPPLERRSPRRSLTGRRNLHSPRSQSTILVLAVAGRSLHAPRRPDVCLKTQEQAGCVYRKPDAWARRAIVNVGHSIWFSSNRTTMEYARGIWRAKSCPVDHD